ncbi:MAG: hypothetical protein ACE5WD_11030 [Candidatus Aminicenantia bacterium]
MIKKLFWKEWKENFNLFILVLFSLIVFIIIGLKYFLSADYTEAYRILAEIVWFFFVPLIALIIGSGGFYAEFSDNAWTYLFSRPISRWKIWVIKYFSNLTVLIFIYLVFLFLTLFFPGFRETINDFFIFKWRGMSTAFIWLFLISLYLYTISFSLSILYERQIIILLFSILVVLGLAYLYYKIVRIGSGIIFPPYVFYLKGILFLTGASFLVASLWTFVQADFSQLLKKIFIFFKYVSIFLILSLIISSAWTIIYYGKRGDFLSIAKFDESDVYFVSGKGLFRWNLKENKLTALVREYIRSGFSLGKKYLVYVKQKERIRKYYSELWTLNKNIGIKKCLIKQDNKRNAFLFRFIFSPVISPDEEKIAFATRNYKLLEEPRSVISFCQLWTISLDGTGLKRISLDQPISEMRIIGWTKVDRNIVISYQSDSGSLSSRKLIKINPEDESYLIVSEDLVRIYLPKISPVEDLICFSYFDQFQGKEVLVIFNLITFEMRRIDAADSFHSLRWSKDGEKIIFLKKVEGKKEFAIYSLADNEVRVVDTLAPRISTEEIDWLGDNGKLIAVQFKDSISRLKILSDDFKEIKEYNFPKDYSSSIYLYGFQKEIIFQNFRQKEMWEFDLENQKWTKIY